jgi:hypothetical protein
MVEYAAAPYNVANSQHDLVIHDAGLRVGYWRGVSHNMNCFANESFVDEMALAAGKDPVEYRMSMLEGKPRFQNVLKLATAKAGYSKGAPKGRAFGKADGDKMPLQAYGRHLKAYNTPAISIVTEMRFDIDSATPKLVFSPVRALEEDELKAAVKLQNHPDTIKAITMNVSQMDGVIPAPKGSLPMDEPTPAPKAEPKAAPKAEKVEAEEVAEPIKVTKKSAPAAEPKSELSDIVGDWDD